MPLQEEIPYLAPVLPIDGANVVGERTLALALEDVPRQNVREGGSGDGAVLAAGDPHPGGRFQAGFHDRLGKQGKTQRSFRSAKCDVPDRKSTRLNSSH